MKNVLYVGFYSVLNEEYGSRNYSLAAAKKMDFVTSAVVKAGYSVEIVSPAYINDVKFYFKKTQKIQLDANVKLTLTPSWGGKNKLLRVGRVLLSNLWLFCYLLRHASKGDPVLVYHNYGLAIPVLLAKKIKRFNLILEIEEQYSMVWKLSRYNKWKEDMLLKQARRDSLVVSELLAEKLGIEDPIVSYGNYNAYKGVIPKKNTDSKIRLIYTGSIDSVKNSAYMAMEVMPFLPDNYEVKLSGPIAKGENEKFYSALERINEKCGRKACEYMGVLDDEEYKNLLLSADIALNLQKEGDFGDFLFPSKILTYLSYNIPVVTTKGGSIVKSSVADILDFADDFSAERIAECVMNVNLFDKTDRRQKLDELSREFIRKIETVLMKDGE